MQKLIELLNEFLKKENKSIYTFYWNQVFNCIHRGNGERCDKEWICSKSFGFIKWLVENEKIDLRKLKNIYMSDYGSSDDIFLAYDKGEQGIIYIVDYYESLLMLLAIQDEPINLLISILK